MRGQAHDYADQGFLPAGELAEALGGVQIKVFDQRFCVMLIPRLPPRGGNGEEPAHLDALRPGHVRPGEDEAIQHGLVVPDRLPVHQHLALHPELPGHRA